MGGISEEKLWIDFFETFRSTGYLRLRSNNYVVLSGEQLKDMAGLESFLNGSWYIGVFRYGENGSAPFIFDPMQNEIAVKMLTECR